MGGISSLQQAKAETSGQNGNEGTKGGACGTTKPYCFVGGGSVKVLAKALMVSKIKDVPILGNMVT